MAITAPRKLMFSRLGISISGAVARLMVTYTVRFILTLASAVGNCFTTDNKAAVSLYTVSWISTLNPCASNSFFASSYDRPVTDGTATVLSCRVIQLNDCRKITIRTIKMPIPNRTLAQRGFPVMNLNTGGIDFSVMNMLAACYLLQKQDAGRTK